MKLLVTFSRKTGKKPIIAQIVKETGVLINVERASIESSQGEVLVDVPDDQCDIVRRKFEEQGVSVRLLDRGISLDESECVDCGACVSSCPQEVFYLDRDWCLRLREERCVLCGRCVEACPQQALSVRDEA